MDRQGDSLWISFVAGVGFVTDAYDLFAVTILSAVVAAAYPPLCHCWIRFSSLCLHLSRTFVRPFVVAMLSSTLILSVLLNVPNYFLDVTPPGHHHDFMVSQFFHSNEASEQDIVQHFHLEDASVRVRWNQNSLAHSDDKINSAIDRLTDLVDYPTQVAEFPKWSWYVCEGPVEPFYPNLYPRGDQEMEHSTDLYLAVASDIGLGEAQRRRHASFYEIEMELSDIHHSLTAPPQYKELYRHALRNKMRENRRVSCNYVAMFGIALMLCFHCWAPQISYLVHVIGRKHMYGLELMIVILSALTLALCPPSVSELLISYFLPLRVLMAVGLRGYPLSSIICREFATMKWRSTTRAAAFNMQGTSERDFDGTLKAATIIACTCIFALPTENIWHPITGFIAITSYIAIYLRLAIPESSRYTLDIYPDFDIAIGSHETYKAQRPEMRYIHAVFELLAICHSKEYIMQGGHNSALILPIPPLTIQWKVSVPHQSARLPGLPRPPKLAFSNQIACFLYVATYWCLLDLAFHGFAFRNARIFNMIDRTPDFKFWGVFDNRNAFNLILICAFALENCVAAIGPLDLLRRRSIQTCGVLMLAILFIIVGSTTYRLPIGGTIALYIICQLFFTLGPNTISFIIPGDIFPTRYRFIYSGISITTDKLAIVIRQVTFIALCTIGAARDNERYRFISRAMNTCNDIQSHIRTGNYVITVLHILYPMNQLQRWTRSQCIRFSTISDNFISAIMTIGAMFPSIGRVARLGMAI